MTRTMTLLWALGALCVAPPAGAEQAPVPAASPGPFLHDRGTGIPTSMFGTYIRGGEWIVW